MSRRQFELQAKGAMFRRQQWEDIAMAVALHVMAASGGGKKADGEYLTLTDLLGREPVSLFPSPSLTDAQREEQEWEEMQREAKRNRALVELARVQFELANKDGHGPEVVS